MQHPNYCGCGKARIGREIQSQSAFVLIVQLQIAPGKLFSFLFFLVFYSHIVIMVVLEAVETNFDHFYNHDRGGITKHDSFVLRSALPSSLENESSRKGGRVVLLGENIYIFSTSLLFF